MITKIILITLATLVGLFLVYINIVAIVSKTKATKLSGTRKTVNADTLNDYTTKLQAMIQCPTVYGNGDDSFENFRKVLRKIFPLIHQKAELTVFGDGCLIFKISGKNATKNIMLMSHHDVVDGAGDWKYPPFSATIADGKMWGRGTIDTKTPLFSELQAVEELLYSDYDFEGINLYIGSSNNEECCGDGIPTAIKYFKQHNIRFDVVLDEGGAVTSGMLPGVNNKSAMVAVHEKSRHIYKCVASKVDKGHLGLNPIKDNAIDRMSQFICEVKKSKIFKAVFYSEVKATFTTHAPYMSYPFRLLFANFNIFKGLLIKLLPLVSNQVGAMLKTNLYFTTINGGESPQIQAKNVISTAFLRCIRSETLKKELIKINKIAEKYGIILTEEVADYCEPSDFQSIQYNKLKKVLNSNYPDVIVSPFLLTAGTDARHFTDIADSILRFAPIDLSREQFASVHNPNENITIANIGECVCFYKDYIIEQCT